jgi:GT2 family glycosyltransferase
MTQLPFVSVVVPAYNARRRLPTCLGSLFRQTYPHDRYEIILVDDGSQDDTADRARALGRRWDGALQILRTENGGPARARNAGVRASSGEIIAFMDADCMAYPDWLLELVSTFSAGEAAAVGGPIRNQAYRDRVSRYLTASRFYRHRVRRGHVEYLITINLAVRRTALESIGGFHEAASIWNEDADLSFRLAGQGYMLLLAPRACVVHYGCPTSVRALARQLYRYGRGSYKLSREWPRARQPGRELVRRAVAVMLAPVLALRCVDHAGIWQSISFSPLVVVEHVAFAAGIIRGMMEHDG